MLNRSICVIAHLRALPNQVEAVQAVLLGLVEPTRQEAGCLQYELQQNQSDPTDFVFLEEWESAAALEAHSASSHLQAAGSQLAHLLATPADVRQYQQVL